MRGGEAPSLTFTPPSLTKGRWSGGWVPKNLLQPLPIWLFYYTSFGDDGGYIAVGGDVKGGVGGFSALGGNAYPLNIGYLFWTSLLNGDFIA